MKNFRKSILFFSILLGVFLYGRDLAMTNSIFDISTSSKCINNSSLNSNNNVLIADLTNPKPESIIGNHNS